MTPSSSKLLVVDDDANNRDMLSRRLARRGFEVEVAADGAEAMDKIQKAQYDLVLLDQMMPGMSGLDLLRLLRATYSQSDLPVIMVTAVDQSQSIVEALGHGANDYVMKPVDLPVVSARIQAQLERSRIERARKETDPLTGLSNRAMMLREIEAGLERQRSAPGQMLAVILCDIDGFKAINDGFGHRAGDHVLTVAAQRLRDYVQAKRRSEAPVARTGGDEFALMIEGLESKTAMEAAAADLLRHLTHMIAINDRTFLLSASLGIALHAAGDCTAEGLLRDAELAIQSAKQQGTNRFEIFDPALRERAHIRMRLAADLGDAIARQELAVFYQPKMNLASRTITGFEALVRWKHPQYGMISPSEFIPLAEDTGHIVAIGKWILERACQQLHNWHGKFPLAAPLTMNVNLSVKQLSDPELVPFVERVLADNAIPAETLKLELTESCLMTEIDSAREVLSQLQALHIGLKLDDFGTGYSSLSYLRSLHFDSLKIDRSFVNRVASDHDAHAVVGAIMELARTLHMNVVAEGIESEDQLKELMELGCDVGQGFLFSKPVPAEAAEQQLEHCYLAA